MKTWFLLVAALGGVVCLTMLESFQGTVMADGGAPSVIYAHGVVRASIPYQAPHAGAGQLTVEILDPEDRVLGRVEQRVTVDAGKGGWREDIKLTKPHGGR